MSDYGMKISKAGFDITTCDVKDQIINSEANSLKVWMTGNVDISVPANPVPGGIGTTNIAHNLGYTPFYLVYFKLKDANKLWLQDSLDASDIANYISGYAYSNDTNLVVNVRVNGTSDAFTAKAYYIILIDKAYE